MCVLLVTIRVKTVGHVDRAQLVIDKSLTALPRRQTDGAIVIRCQDTQDAKARVFKLNATVKEPVLIER